eukprot:TRINITY_DN10744_c0_g1_i7.p2 TRINITY_DN10744_c0_g1~~TRINITY_DN10744_c0_g1_i7.p2  ORF type:complete len:256 (+),score=30.88 TRINITY_DN10744_c0_g1_i7:121-888(+)
MIKKAVVKENTQSESTSLCAICNEKIVLIAGEKELPIVCASCQVEMTDETVELLFNKPNDKTANHKKRKQKKESNKYKQYSHELTCCSKLKTIEELKQKLEGIALFSIKDNELQLCDCPFCGVKLQLKDALAIFDKGEIEVMFSSVCIICMKSLETERYKASCNAHFTCANCKEKACTVCTKPKKSTKRCSPEDSKCTIRCDSCNKYQNTLNGSLLDCYHFKCNSCKQSKTAKKLHCSVCKELKATVSVRIESNW